MEMSACVCFGGVCTTTTLHPAAVDAVVVVAVSPAARGCAKRIMQSACRLGECSRMFVRYLSVTLGVLRCVLVCVWATSACLPRKKVCAYGEAPSCEHHSQTRMPGLHSDRLRLNSFA